MSDRQSRPSTDQPWARPREAEDGPRVPEVGKPDTRQLIERMKRIDPRQARRYRQRSGE